MSELPDVAKTEQVIIERTNAFRQSEGRGALARNPALDLAAKSYAQFLAKSGRFSHTADGRDVAARAREAGALLCSVAENLALNSDSRGFSSEKLGSLAVEGWKASAGHRKNMLIEGVTETGTGVARVPAGDPKFVTVQLVGRPEHLAMGYKITNRSQVQVTYKFGPTERVLPANSVDAGRSCLETRVEFLSAGQWPMVQKLAQSYDIMNNTELVVRQGSDARVSIELRR